MPLSRPLNLTAASALLAACADGVTSSPPVTAPPAPVSDVATLLKSTGPGLNVTARSTEVGPTSITMGYSPRDGAQARNVLRLVAIDGVIQPQTEGVDVLASIDPKDIETVEILKGPAAVHQFGDAAQNGVIVITTRKAAASAVPAVPPPTPRT